MTGRVLYDITADANTEGVETLLFVLAFIAIGALVFSQIRRRMADVPQTPDMRRTEGIVRLVKVTTALFLALAVLAGLGQIIDRNALVEHYKNGECETVEGVVEEFTPMPAEGHRYESFVINGVWFEYSDYRAQPGYHKSKSHQGIITGNGQHLRIRYTWTQSYGNVILFIEELTV